MSGTSFWVSQPYDFLQQTVASLSTLTLKVFNSADYTKYFTFSATSLPSANRTISLYDPGADTTLSFGKSKYTSITDAVTLTAADSGSVLGLTTKSAGAYAITLPATASSAGVSYRFISVAVTNAHDITIVADGAVIKGRLIYNTAVHNGSGTTFTYVQANAVVGDFISLFCDGTTWFVDTWSSAATAPFTLA